MAEIRRIGEDDWATLREVRLRSLLDAPDAFGSTYGEESTLTESAWRDRSAGRWRGGAAASFLAIDDDRAIGTATGAEYDDEPGVAHVYAMWVAPDARGAGVGRRLVDAVSGWARDRGCRRLTLTVTESNTDARGLYDACGFVETGARTPLREGSELDVVTMNKNLR